MRRRTLVMPLLAMAIILLLTLGAYWPGLHGGFLFDDFANLPALGATGPVDTWPTFWRYITSGTADPTGRPLALLSFLLDAQNWPADPYPFKLTNLILHLLNGALLYMLLATLGRALGVAVPRRQTAAAFGAALWLLHPLLVSTTLYIVQREAMLPATCAMAGLLIWLHGRDHFVAGRTTQGLFWSVAGLAGFTLLGVLSKANGALLPLYALLIESLICRYHQPILERKSRRVYHALMLLLGWLPTFLIVAYLAVRGWNGLTGDISSLRPWTLGQRLLTEPRIVMDYLSLLWIPQSVSTGLFNDQYLASTSLLHPLSTLPAILAMLVLLSGAWLVRRRYPALALAVLFFFAGQLLESTTIPLELYFEHRNYVPALLMFWPLGLWLADTTALRALKRTLLFATPLLLTLMTHARATVWGDVQAQASIWAQINPDSPRAQANAAQIEIQTGHPDVAIPRLETLLAARPDQAQLAFNLIGARCMTGGISSSDIDAARRAMRGTPNTGALFAHWFDRTLPAAMSGECPGLTPDILLSLINMGLKNPNLAAAGPQQDLTYLRGRIALAQHRPAAALADFQRALDLQVRPDMALPAASVLGQAGYPREGLRMLDHYRDVKGKAILPRSGMPVLHEWVLSRQNYWAKELAHLRRVLSTDAHAANVDISPSNSDESKQD